jgi:hypothetical protein
LKPKSEFNIKNKRTGQLSAWCKSCIRDYQRERWLSVEKTKRLGTLLRLVVYTDLEADCITCHLPIEAGQEVVADDVKLCHASCCT